MNTKFEHRGYAAVARSVGLLGRRRGAKRGGLQTHARTRAEHSGRDRTRPIYCSHGVPKVGAAMEGAKPRVKKGKIGKPIKEPTLAEEMDDEIPWLGDPPKKAVREN